MGHLLKRMIVPKLASGHSGIVRCAFSMPELRELGESPIRRALIKKLVREMNTGDVIVEELGPDQGDVRADVVQVNGALYGFEIKSGRDTLDRLVHQRVAYGQVMNRATVVTVPSHMSGVRALVPSWWGMVVVTHELTFDVVRAPARNPELDGYALASLLWRDEALDELRLRGLARGLSRRPRAAIWERLAGHVEVGELQSVVAARLKSRQNWRSAGLHR